MNYLIRWLLCSGFLICNVASAQFDNSGEASLVEIADNIYHTQSTPGRSNSTVIVTDEGVVVVDGTCRGAATPEWLKGEISRRFGVPVKYLILSHDHSDHLCGTHVFDDTAVTISHVNARAHIIREGRNASIPDVVFEDQMEIFIGGKRIILYYLGPTHSDNLIQIHLPDDGVLIAPDLARPGRSLVLPDFRDSDVNNMIDALQTLSMLDNVDIVVPGHGLPGTQENFGLFRAYLIALRDRVLEQMIAGASIDEILERVTMDDFSDYAYYDQWLRGNVVSMWDKMYRYREPNNTTMGAGEYQSAYPVGFSISGDTD